MSSLSKTHLSTLTKQLQDQVDILTTYLAAENLQGPTFVGSEGSQSSAISTLPPNIEEARQKAYSLSWGLHTLLGTPRTHLLSLLFQVFPVSNQ